jgi:acyl-CoA synthetase (AMP-forming)/AMP-acid ligase II
MTPSPLNVASHLARLAAAEPDQPALHYPHRGVNLSGPTPYTTLTFRELNDLADRLAFALDSIGIQRGTRTALMVPPSPDFFALTFALFKVAAVPVLIDPGMGVKNLGKCLAEAEPEAFIGVAKAHAARRLLGWAKKTIRTTLNVGRWRFFCHYSLEQLKQPGSYRAAYRVPDVSADETAAILFTSGSTGVAKGAVYTHGIFAAQVELLKQTYGIEPGEIDLCTFPLFALFGPALGMTCVLPDMDPTRPASIDPHKAVAQIRQFGVTNMFGSPAVIRRLGEWGSSPSPLEGEGSERSERVRGKATAVPSPGGETPPPSPSRREGKNATLASLRRVISAGAPASAAAIERFVKLLPESAQVFTPYGATEALPVANVGSREILSETRHLTDQGKGVCVGRPMEGMQVSVIPISDGPVPEWDESRCLPPGEIGEFVVRGPVVTKEYFNRPEATRLAKIHDPKTGEILHRMGDVGYLDDRGRLWFCGRKSHRVVTPHGTLYTDMVEPFFNYCDLVARTALVGVTREGVTYPVLCVEKPNWPYPKSKALTPEAIESQLRKRAHFNVQTQRIDTFLLYPSTFPVDVRHNSKIFREKLAVWADKKLGKHWNPADNKPVLQTGSGAPT